MDRESFLTELTELLGTNALALYAIVIGQTEHGVRTRLRKNGPDRRDQIVLVLLQVAKTAMAEAEFHKTLLLAA